MSQAKSKALAGKKTNTAKELHWGAAKNSRKCPDCKAVFKTENEYDKHWH